MVSKNHMGPEEYIVFDRNLVPNRDAIFDRNAVTNFCPVLDVNLLAYVAFGTHLDIFHDVCKCPDASFFANPERFNPS
jgi:hypothetical protein